MLAVTRLENSAISTMKDKSMPLSKRLVKVEAIQSQIKKMLPDVVGQELISKYQVPLRKKDGSVITRSKKDSRPRTRVAKSLAQWESEYRVTRKRKDNGEPENSVIVFVPVK